MCKKRSGRRDNSREIDRLVIALTPLIVDKQRNQLTSSIDAPFWNLFIADKSTVFIFS